MAERALVTGVAGFIGSHLAEALLARGDAVVGIDCLTDYYDPRLKEANLALLAGHQRFRFVRADLNAVDLAQVAGDVNVVFHQAAQAGVRASWGREFTTYTRENVDATQRLLEFFRERPLRRFVYASSSSVYGETAALPMREDAPTQPHSPYGVTKLAAEHLTRLYHRNFGLPTVSLRYFTVYGPRQRPDMAFRRFIGALLRGEPVAVYGDGLQTRDFTYIDNVIQANLAACAAPKAACGKVVNISCGERVSLLDILEIVYGLAGKRVSPKFEPGRVGDVRDSLADISLARDLIGYDPKVSFSEGLAKTFDWFRGSAGS